MKKRVIPSKSSMLFSSLVTDLSANSARVSAWDKKSHTEAEMGEFYTKRLQEEKMQPRGDRSLPLSPTQAKGKWSPHYNIRCNVKRQRGGIGTLLVRQEVNKSRLV